MQPIIGPVGTIPFILLNRHGRRGEIAEARRQPAADRKWRLTFARQKQFNLRRKQYLDKIERVRTNKARRTA